MNDPDQILANLRPAICASVKALLPKLRECEPHEGKYSLEELKRDGLPSPAVKVSCLGAKQDITLAASPATFMLQMAAYVVTKDSLGKRRDTAAANICQTLLSLVPENDWGLDGVGRARDTGLHTLVSTKVKSTGVSLWAVTWHQPVSFFQPGLKPLGVELYVSIAPEIGTANVGSYEEIGGAGDE
jgi:hypothetical protein